MTSAYCRICRLYKDISYFKRDKGICESCIEDIVWDEQNHNLDGDEEIEHIKGFGDSLGDWIK